MKKLILVTLLTMLTSSGVNAKATIEQAYADDARYHAAIADATKNATRERLREDWRLYVDDSEESGGSIRTYQSYSAQCVNFGRTDTVLKPIAGYTCALTKTAGNFKGWMEKTEVVQRGGYWRMIIDCGKADVYGSAICWNNK